MHVLCGGCAATGHYWSQVRSILYYWLTSNMNTFLTMWMQTCNYQLRAANLASKSLLSLATGSTAYNCHFFNTYSLKCNAKSKPSGHVFITLISSLLHEALTAHVLYSGVFLFFRPFCYSVNKCKYRTVHIVCGQFHNLKKLNPHAKWDSILFIWCHTILLDNNLSAVMT